MKRNTFYLMFTVLFALSAVAVSAAEKSKSAVEANVFTTKDGEKHFICPVMGGEDVVTKDTPYSVVDGKKYYHCCGGCSEKLTANPDKYLKNFAIPANVLKVDDDGQHFQCVVSGEMGLVNAKTTYADVDGKRYYFCCDKCSEKFEADRSKFMKNTAGTMKHDHKCTDKCNHAH